MKTKIALAKPFEGAPIITVPSVFGASSKKPVLLRISVIGQRPIEYKVHNLPSGLTLNGNVLSGKVENDGNYEILLEAKNALGKSAKKITLEIKDQNVLVTPLLGYTTWNAFGSDVTQEKVEGVACKMVDLGITEYGYSYVNTDSGWQGEYGGEYDAIMPNFKFPNMKQMTDKIHSYGLKCGIYSTPMLNAWGCPKELESIPGCTVGESDYRFSPLNGGIGTVRKEKNNAEQWSKWGFDYLKYDWAPTDSVNADLMRKELIKQERDFGFCVTVKAIKEYASYFSKYCNSYRSNPDTLGYFNNLVEVYDTYFDFESFICKGHYFDLDMLDFGTSHMPENKNALTDDEKVIEFSMRAFLSSPIQISSTLENVDQTELSIYCNEEIIEVNQDCAFNTPKILLKQKSEGRRLDVFEKELVDGFFAYAFFNLGKTNESININSDSQIRDLWAKEEIGKGSICLDMPPHTARILKSKTKITL